MGERSFRELIENKWSERKFVCVGLDSEWAKLPAVMKLNNKEYAKSGNENSFDQYIFNRGIVEKTADLTAAYKINSAFYEELPNGLLCVKETIEFIKSVDVKIPVILDAKRADIGNTNIGYVRMAFEYLKADAITVHPYLGQEALRPFLDRDDKGIFVLCRTSNPGAGELQDIDVIASVEDEKRWGLGIGDNLESWPLKLYQYIAYRVSREWNKSGNCGLVVGAVYPEELREVRKVAGDMPILIPGIGAQGGDVEQTIKASRDSRGRGMIINSSRGIIFAENPREEALKLHNQIVEALK